MGAKPHSLYRQTLDCAARQTPPIFVPNLGFALCIQWRVAIPPLPDAPNGLYKGGSCCCPSSLSATQKGAGKRAKSCHTRPATKPAMTLCHVRPLRWVSPSPLVSVTTDFELGWTIAGGVGKSVPPMVKQASKNDVICSTAIAERPFWGAHASKSTLPLIRHQFTVQYTLAHTTSRILKLPFPLSCRTLSLWELKTYVVILTRGLVKRHDLGGH